MYVKDLNALNFYGKNIFLIERDLYIEYKNTVLPLIKNRRFKELFEDKNFLLKTILENLLKKTVLSTKNEAKLLTKQYFLMIIHHIITSMKKMGVRAIDLSGIKVCALGIMLLSEILRGYEYITEIDLSNSFFNDDEISFLFKNISQNPYFLTINLVGYNLNINNLKYFQKIMNKDPKKLILCNEGGLSKYSKQLDKKSNKNNKKKKMIIEFLES